MSGTRDVPEGAAALRPAGPAGRAWDRLTGWLGSSYGISADVVGSAKRGWSARYRRGGKSLVLLDPATDGATATVVIGPSLWATFGAAGLRPATREAYERAHPYPDGRWLRLPLRDDADVDEIERLIAMKSPPPRRPPAARGPA